MHPIRLISSILKGKWFIDPDFAFAQGPVIAGLLNNQTALYALNGETEDLFATGVSIVSAERGIIYGVRHSYRNGFDNAPAGSVAIIDIKGALMKDDQECGSYGTATIGRIIKKADNHPNIIGIVLNVDSPGGTVDGTEALAAIVKSTGKPVITFIDGLMASAALWIGTSANEIIASTDTDEIGSVGVQLSFIDVQPYWESLGIVFRTLKANTSPEKNSIYEGIRKGEKEATEKFIKEVLDVLDEKFMNAVRENRPQVTDKHLTGKIFFARDVMGVFVDSIGTIEKAIERAAQLADEKDAANDIDHNYNKSTMKQFTRLNAVLGVESLESTDNSVSLNDEQLELVEGALSETDQVVAARDTAIRERDSANAARDLAVTERETAVAEAETANAARTTAETNLANVVNAFDAIDATVAAAETPEAKAEAIRTLLAAKPGVKPAVNLDGGDTEMGEAFDGFTAEEKEAIKNL